MSELIGKTIGQYQLVELIDQGGNTVVCKGFQPAANRYVAVKFLKPNLASDQTATMRFKQEGDLLAQFHHPRLLEFFENGEAEGIIFRAERLAENRSLKDHLVTGQKNPFYDTSRVINLFQGIAEGLEMIHSRGYVHGNLKPGNILLDAMMNPLLSDFALAVRPGNLISPYMAPEQVQGAAVDRRTDIYALGVLLYTTLVGIEPPAGVVVSPRSSRPELPESVERMIFKAMAQIPDQRFQSATEFFNVLRTAFGAAPAQQPVYATLPPAPAPGVSQTVNVESQKKGTNWIGIIFGIIILIMLCCGTVYFYQNYSQDQTVVASEPSAPVEQPTQPPAEPTQPPAITVIVPTRETRPTNEPRPTDVPPVPTTPPEQPTTPPEAGQLPVVPEQQPASPNPICGSLGLIAVPLIVLSAGRLTKKRRSK